MSHFIYTDLIEVYLI